MAHGFWDLRDESDTEWFLVRLRESLDRNPVLRFVLILALAFVAGRIGQSVGVVSARLLQALVEGLQFAGTAAAAVGLVFHIAPYFLVFGGLALLDRRFTSSSNSAALVVPLTVFAIGAANAERLRAVLPASSLTAFDWMGNALLVLAIALFAVLVVRRLPENRYRRA